MNDKSMGRFVLRSVGLIMGINKYIVKICDAEVFDAVVTDWECVKEQVAALEEKGVTVTMIPTDVFHYNEAVAVAIERIYIPRYFEFEKSAQ